MLSFKNLFYYTDNKPFLFSELPTCNEILDCSFPNVHKLFPYSYYLIGALWPVSSKAIQFAKSAILSAHSSCRAKRGGVRLDVLCPCLRCAVCHCQIQNNFVQVQLAERQVALLGFIGLPC